MPESRRNLGRKAHQLVGGIDEGQPHRTGVIGDRIGGQNAR